MDRSWQAMLAVDLWPLMVEKMTTDRQLCTTPTRETRHGTKGTIYVGLTEAEIPNV
jgi:hypothetical protein